MTVIDYTKNSMVFVVLVLGCRGLAHALGLCNVKTGSVRMKKLVEKGDCH